jgi:hypothetical protein
MLGFQKPKHDRLSFSATDDLTLLREVVTQNPYDKPMFVDYNLNFKVNTSYQLPINCDNFQIDSALNFKYRIRSHDF